MGSYPTYEEWKLVSFNRLYMDTWVLILPMRNGNFSITDYIIFYMFCSYPTYEEWKLAHLSPIYASFLSSYPTYEEWKHNNNMRIAFDL